MPTTRTGRFRRAGDGRHRARVRRGARRARSRRLATFGTAVDVTVAELSIESFFPADADTARAVRER
jgi:hypothetical protein